MLTREEGYKPDNQRGYNPRNDFTKKGDAAANHRTVRLCCDLFELTTLLARIEKKLDEELPQE